MQVGPRISETQLSPRNVGALQSSGSRNRCRQQASSPGATLHASSSSPTLSCSSSCRGTFAETYRVLSPEEEWKLQMKGEKERKLAAAKELRLKRQEDQRQEEERKRLAREAAEAEKKEAQRTFLEESRLKRLWDIEERREQEAAKAKERLRQQEAELEAAQKPWSVRRLSPESRRKLGLGSREEDWCQEQKHNLEEGEKDLRVAEDKAAKEDARHERIARQEQIRLSYHAQRQALQSDRERKRQQELLKRNRQREELEARRERRLRQKDNRLLEAKARSLIELQQRQSRLLWRQQLEEQQEIEDLKAKGAKELAIRAAQDARQMERELARTSELKVRTKQEAREAFLQESKQQQMQIEKIRRSLDIDLRKERAAEAKREREEFRRSEEDLHSQIVFPKPPSLILKSPGPLTASLDALLSSRSMTHSRSDGHLLGYYSAR